MFIGSNRHLCTAWSAKKLARRLFFECQGKLDSRAIDCRACSRLHPASELQQVQLLLVEGVDRAIAKSKVAGPTRYDDLAKQDTTWVEDVDAVATAGIHVASGVNLQAVGNTDVGHGEDAFVGQHGRCVEAVGMADIERINGPCSGQTSDQINVARVANVGDGLIRRKGNAIGVRDPICHDADLGCAGNVRVDLGRQLGDWSNSLLIAVGRVGEVDRTSSSYVHIVGRIEGASEVVVDDDFAAFVLAILYVYKAAGCSEIALGG